MSEINELKSIAKELDLSSILGNYEETLSILENVEKACLELQKSFCGSWLGYHSRVYYEGLLPAPAGANFSQEWGLKFQDGPYEDSFGSIGRWVQYERDQIIEKIFELAGIDSLDKPAKDAKKAEKILNLKKNELTSILQLELASNSDEFISRFLENSIKKIPKSQYQILNSWCPQNRAISRDSIAVGQGFQAPPHMEILAEVESIRDTFSCCSSASEASDQVASHLERKSRKKMNTNQKKLNIFIGHGHSLVWLELKYFLKDRLGLPVEEFNSVSTAGVSTEQRLTEMLNSAGFAFLVLTGEDESKDGTTRARLNVIHEVGLFQGKLGFRKAIVLLEEGCDEFSNIHGLGQIRFDKGKLKGKFEEIRQVLEREGLLTQTVLSNSFEP